MGGLIKTVIRHKFVQNIPDIWPIPQLFLPLQRQTRNETIKTRNEESIKNHAVQRSGAGRRSRCAHRPSITDSTIISNKQKY